MDILQGNNTEKYPQAAHDPGVAQNLPQGIGEMAGGIDSGQGGGDGQRWEMEGDADP